MQSLCPVSIVLSTVENASNEEAAWYRHSPLRIGIVKREAVKNQYPVKYFYECVEDILNKNSTIRPEVMSIIKETQAEYSQRLLNNPSNKTGVIKEYTRNITIQLIEELELNETDFNVSQEDLCNTLPKLDQCQPTDSLALDLSLDNLEDLETTFMEDIDNNLISKRETRSMTDETVGLDNSSTEIQIDSNASEESASPILAPAEESTTSPTENTESISNESSSSRSLSETVGINKSSTDILLDSTASGKTTFSTLATVEASTSSLPESTKAAVSSTESSSSRLITETVGINNSSADIQLDSTSSGESIFSTLATVEESTSNLPERTNATLSFTESTSSILMTETVSVDNSSAKIQLDSTASGENAFPILVPLEESTTSFTDSINVTLSSTELSSSTSMTETVGINNSSTEIQINSSLLAESTFSIFDTVEESTSSLSESTNVKLSSTESSSSITMTEVVSLDNATTDSTPSGESAFPILVPVDERTTSWSNSSNATSASTDPSSSSLITVASSLDNLSTNIQLESNSSTESVFPILESLEESTSSSNETTTSMSTQSSSSISKTGLGLDSSSTKSQLNSTTSGESAFPILVPVEENTASPPENTSKTLTSIEPSSSTSVTEAVNIDNSSTKIQLDSTTPRESSFSSLPTVEEGTEILDENTSTTLTSIESSSSSSMTETIGQDNSSVEIQLDANSSGESAFPILAHMEENTTSFQESTSTTLTSAGSSFTSFTTETTSLQNSSTKIQVDSNSSEESAFPILVPVEENTSSYPESTSTALTSTESFSIISITEAVSVDNATIKIQVDSNSTEESAFPILVPVEASATSLPEISSSTSAFIESSSLISITNSVIVDSSTTKTQVDSNSTEKSAFPILVPVEASTTSLPESTSTILTSTKASSPSSMTEAVIVDNATTKLQVDLNSSEESAFPILVLLEKSSTNLPEST